MTLTTKQKILIIVGAIIFLIADISMIERIVIIAGIVAYFFMRKQLLVDNSIEYTQKIRDTLIIPIVQIIASFFLFEEASGAVKSAGKIDSLHDISTYTPFLGDLGKGLDIANQLGVLPDIERSQSTLEYINSATTVNNVVSFGAILIIILAIAELYGVFRLGKFTKKQMLMLYGGASIAFIVCSIYFGIYMEKFMGVLAGIFSGTDEYPFAIIFPIVTLILVGAFYKAYSNALENLFNYSLPELVKENNLQEQPNRQSEEQTDRNSSEQKVQSEPMQVEETGRIKEKPETPPQAKIIIKEKAEQKSFFRFNILFGIGLVVLMGVVAWWILQSNEKDNYTPTVENQTENIADKDIYEQRSNEIIRELTSKYGDKIQVEYKYPELSKYCTFGLKGEDDYNFRYLLVYDLDREILKQFDTQSLFTNNHKELFLATYSISINSQNNKLLISGNNGANSIGYTEYLLELDPSNWQIREICSGSEVIKKQDGYIANRRIMTKWGDCVAMSEFVNIDIYYNLNGNLIIPSTSGNNYQLKGLIDNKYSVTMQLSIQNNKIYGKYYYEKNGSDNFLYLYGGISDSGDVALLEFNSEGQQTSNFKGRFTNDFFYGTFTNYKNIEMPFELHFENNNLKTTEVTLKRYYNSRFGYSILYPSSFSNLRESDNSDGCRFSKDNHTYLSVSGMYNGLNETIEDKYNEYKDKSPVYSKLKGNWFVVSDYTENGDIYYLKTVLKDDIFMTAILYYPNSEKVFYSKIIPKIFTNFPD